jgi:hyperosmotically inducible periplasmic protein
LRKFGIGKVGRQPRLLSAGDIKEIQMKRALSIVPLILAGGICCSAADEVSMFKAYVDTDLCARLMLGPITTERIACSQQTYKEGSGPVLVRLSNNMVLDVNNEKMIKDLVGQLADVSGQLKAKNGEVKLQSVTPIKADAIPQGDPARKLLDVRMYRTAGSPQLYEKIRHELAMMPYISEFDFISFTLTGNDVILTGWTVRQTNRSDAQNAVKNIEGVGTIVNNIEVLPLGSFDMQIRARVRAVLQQNLSRYFWGNGSDIKIVVKNGDVILLGIVSQQSDKDIANIRVNGVPGVFHVFNMLRVQSGEQKKG